MRLIKYLLVVFLFPGIALADSLNLEGQGSQLLIFDLRDEYSLYRYPEFRLTNHNSFPVKVKLGVKTARLSPAGDTNVALEVKVDPVTVTIPANNVHVVELDFLIAPGSEESLCPQEIYTALRGLVLPAESVSGCFSDTRVLTATWPDSKIRADGTIRTSTPIIGSLAYKFLERGAPRIVNSLFGTVTPGEGEEPGRGEGTGEF